MLKIDALAAGYGKRDVLRDVSVEVPEQGIVVVLGANGAGKSTLLRTISGFTQIRGGDIRLRDMSLVGQPPDRIAAAGIAHVPEGRRILEGLTVEENLRLGAMVLDRAERDAAVAEVVERFPLLAERSDQDGGSLSGGEQQLLAIGRALAARPDVLLVDEPTLGIAPQLADDIFQQLRAIREESRVAMLIVEQGSRAIGFADHVYVMENGSITLHGSRDEIAGDPRIRRSYLGI